ncbi:phage terminase large subunit [Komagataeibacter rhaeticus]|nr:phage terminase large subunit [Komagataeibacter rhaeticus]
MADTFPAVMRACFPTVPWALSRTDWTVELPNGSSIVFGGLDDEERTEKILGLEFATVYLNEASQITYGARNMLLTRLAQKSPLALKEYVDANPPPPATGCTACLRKGGTHIRHATGPRAPCHHAA